MNKVAIFLRRQWDEDEERNLNQERKNGKLIANMESFQQRKLHVQVELITSCTNETSLNLDIVIKIIKFNDKVTVNRIS